MGANPSLEESYDAKSYHTIENGNYPKENDIIVQYEAFRKHIGELRNEFKEKERFVFSMKLDHISIKKSLKAYFDKYYK